MAERPFQPVPNTPLVADPTGDAIWKRWLQGLQRFMSSAVRGPGSSTDNAVARWDGTSGTFLNNSGVIIDDSNNVSGIVNLTTTGNTQLGDASGDTLTINAGTWTYGANWTSTRTAGAQAAGITNIQHVIATFSGDSGGTSNIRGYREDYTGGGANPILVMTGRHLVSDYNGSGGVNSHVGIFGEAIVSGSGNVVTARCFLTGAAVTGGATVTTFDGYNIGSTVITSGSITTVNGFKISNIGNANATNAIGIKIDNFTSSTTMRGIQSSLSSGTGKHNLYIDGTAENVIVGNVKIGSTASPAAPLDVLQGTLGSAVQILASTASNDDPIETTYQQKVTTTDATVTTIATVAIPASTTVLIEAKVTARRTGGASGTAEDGAAYIIAAAYKNVAGTATEIGEGSVFSAEDQAAWACTVTPSGSNALIQVTGAAGNNVSWVATYRLYPVST